MRTRVVVNPASGGGRSGIRATALRPKLEAALGPLDWLESRSAEHLTELIAEVARDGAPRVLVAGGDGAALAALEGVRGTETALGILPTGTGNDFAVSVGLPLDAAAAVDIIAAEHIRRVDVGEVHGRLFGCVLGMGMDTEAIRRVSAARILRRGHLLYTLAALRTLLTYPSPHLCIEWGESPSERWEGEVVFAAIMNTRSYAGGMKITPLARTDDGKLDLCIIPRLGLPRLLASFRRVLDGKHVGMPGIVHAQSERIRVTTERPVPITLDGDLTDLTTPLDAVVRAGSIRVLGAPLAHSTRHERPRPLPASA